MPSRSAPPIVLSQTAQEAMRVIAPALAGVLIGLSWFGVGGLFLHGRPSPARIAGVVLFGLPPGSPVPGVAPLAARRDGSTPPATCGPTAASGLIALTTIGVVVIGFPYLTFLPALADERFDVGAGGYGVMAGIAGLGAVVRRHHRPAARVGGRAPVAHHRRRPVRRSALALIGLGLAHWFGLALVMLVAIGAGGLVFQTTTQSLMLSLSDSEYHGRMQSMVVLGFSGFGLAALPLGAVRRRRSRWS